MGLFEQVQFESTVFAYGKYVWYFFSLFLKGCLAAWAVNIEQVHRFCTSAQICMWSNFPWWCCLPINIVRQNKWIHHWSLTFTVWELLRCVVLNYPSQIRMSTAKHWTLQSHADLFLLSGYLLLLRVWIYEPAWKELLCDYSNSCSLGISSSSINKLIFVGLYINTFCWTWHLWISKSKWLLVFHLSAVK